MRDFWHLQRVVRGAADRPRPSFDARHPQA
jgi:hypothetical protein